MKIIDPVNGKIILVKSSEVRTAFITPSHERRISINVGGEIIHLDYSKRTPELESEFNRVKDWLVSSLGDADE